MYRPIDSIGRPWCMENVEFMSYTWSLVYGKPYSRRRCVAVSLAGGWRSRCWRWRSSCSSSSIKSSDLWSHPPRETNLSDVLGAYVFSTLVGYESVVRLSISIRSSTSTILLSPNPPAERSMQLHSLLGIASRLQRVGMARFISGVHYQGGCDGRRYGERFQIIGVSHFLWEQY